MYNYNPQNLNQFYSNANIITQYNHIDDDNYYDYYHNNALLLAVEIDQNQVKSFEDYVKNNVAKISTDDATIYIHNKIKTI